MMSHEPSVGDRGVNRKLLHVWNFIRCDTQAADFELWVYANSDLESIVGGNLYLDLLAADYRDARAVAGMQRRLWSWLKAAFPQFAVETYGYETDPWQTVRLFAATCQTCQHQFAVPVLSDFAYGEFILSTQTGIHHAYLTALGNIIWDEIAELYRQVAKELAKEVVISQLHRVIARCADPLMNQGLEMHYRCPVCHSHSIRYDLSAPLHDAAIAVTSFRAFVALNSAAKLEQVRELAMPTGLE